MPNLSAVALSIRAGGVAILELNRPQKRNAISQQMMKELTSHLQELDRNMAVRAVIITSIDGSPFCAGVDLIESSTISTADAYRTGWLQDLEVAFGTCRKPILAAVRGFAFGGGFEIALLSDMILAAADAQFGFPEIKLGTIPGLGGTQRLTKAVGKHKAMELILTGNSITSARLEALGVVNKVCSEKDVLEEAIQLAEVVATRSAPAIQLAKQAVKTAEATTLKSGLEIERCLYYTSFSFVDCQEGIAAFLEKRSPNVRHQ